MPATLPLALLCLVLGLVVVGRSRRLNRSAAEPVAEPVRHRMHAAAQFGQVGATTLTEPIRSMAYVAPVGSASVAIDVEGMDGGPLARTATDHVVMARGWSRGHLVLSFGAMRPAYVRCGPFPMSDSGWEIHLVEASGRLVRLRGLPGAVLDDDLLRLHYRLREALVAHAA